MEWDANKLNALLHHFDITIHSISKTTGITKEKLYKLKAGYIVGGKLDSKLTAFMNALKAAKVKELQTMIEYYETFNP